MIRLVLAGVLVLGPPTAACAQDFGTDVHTRPNPQNGARADVNAALEAGDFARALKLLAPLVAATPTDAVLLYDMGSAQDALDQGSPAEASYRASIAADAKFLEPRVALGLLLARAGTLDGARAEFAGAVALTEGDRMLRARAYRAMARIDARTRPADAREELLAALKLSPETPEDALLTAELAEDAGNGAPAAEATYRRLLTAQPNDPSATAGLAHLLMQHKRGAEAETLLRASLATHPGDPGLTVQLATALAAEGKATEALPLVAALPPNAGVQRVLARLYLQTKDYAKAEPLLAQLSVQSPQDAELADERADALVHLKRFAEAQALLARVVAQPALWPVAADRAEAAGRLAFAASENNDPAETLRALQVRATVLPPSAPVLFLAAISYDKLHQLKAAQQAYQQFLAASNGANPDEEFEARHRLVALEHTK